MRFKLTLAAVAWLAVTPAHSAHITQSDDPSALTVQVGELLIAGRGADARAQTDTFADILGIDRSAMFTAVTRDAARRLQDSGQGDAAIIALGEAIKTEPQAHDLLYARAAALLNQNNTPAAEADLTKVEALAAGRPALTAEACVQRVLLGLDAERGMQLCDLAIATDPNPDTFSLKGMALVHQDKHDDALAYFERALGLKPDHAIALYGRGYVGMMDHGHDHAHDSSEADISAAKLLDPDVALRFPLLLEVH